MYARILATDERGRQKIIQRYPQQQENITITRAASKDSKGFDEKLNDFIDNSINNFENLDKKLNNIQKDNKIIQEDLNKMKDEIIKNLAESNKNLQEKVKTLEKKS